jgi:dsRNA-specific ribonuclease
VGVFHTHPPVYIIDLIVTVKGDVVGYGEGLSINQAKYHAAKQALQYFQTHPPT